MPIETSPAIVLKSVDFSESSLILTLFTRDFGKIQGIAKGGRRLKNPYESALDLLAQISVSFIHKKSEALDILTEAKLYRRFHPSLKSLKGLYAGYYLAELLLAMTEDNEPMPELFDLAQESLVCFETGEETSLDLLRFEWGLLKLSGQEPATRFCVGCGRDVPIDEMIANNRRISFAMHDGGTLCRQCRTKAQYRQVASLSAPGLRLLQCLGERKTCRIVNDPNRQHGSRSSTLADGADQGKRYVRLNDGTELFSTGILKEVRGLMSYYMTQLLGYRPVMYDYLETI